MSKIINKLREDSKINVVVDEVGSPTNSIDLATAIFRIIPKLRIQKQKYITIRILGFVLGLNLLLRLIAY